MTPVKLKPDELAAFKEAFDMFDRNGDGSISTKVEFLHLMEANCYRYRAQTLFLRSCTLQ